MRRLIIAWLSVWIIVSTGMSAAQSPGPSISQDGMILQNNVSTTGTGTPINVGGYGIITFQVTALSGTATIVPESSLDASNYNTLTCYALDGATTVTSFSGTGTWRCNVTGQNWARARISVCTGCTVSVQATKWVSGQVSSSRVFKSLTPNAYVKTDTNDQLISQVVPIPCSDGGTGLTAGTSGGVLAYTGSCTLASSGALTQNAMVLGGGGSVPTAATQPLTNGQLYIGRTGNPPIAASIIAGTAISVGLSDGGVTISNTSPAPSLPISPANGGTGANTSASTGVPSISAGTWSVVSTLATTLGGTGVNTSSRFKLLTSTYDISTASGTQSIAHGVTGTPKLAIIIADIESLSAPVLSIGVSDGSTNYTVRTTASAGAVANIKTTFSVFLTTNTDVDNQAATVTFTSTNVNLNWTKTGNPTGTAAFWILLFF